MAQDLSTTTSPPVDDDLGGIDEDLETELGDTGVWGLIEQSTVDPITKVETTTRLWEAKLLPSGIEFSTPPSADYAVFYSGEEWPNDSLSGQSSSGKRKAVDFDPSKAFLISWRFYDYFRCLNPAFAGGQYVPAGPPIPRFLGGYDMSGKYIANILVSPEENGKPILDYKALWPTSASPTVSNYAAYFDMKFYQGQCWANDVKKVIANVRTLNTAAGKEETHNWMVKENIPWRRCKSGDYAPGNDGRTWDEMRDGIAFAESLYLRVSRKTGPKSQDSIAADLLKNSQLSWAEVNPTGLYVLQGDLAALAADRYFSVYPPRLRVRNSRGIEYTLILDYTRRKWVSLFQKKAYWETVWNASLKTPPGGPVRSRNVRGLDMLFVLRDESRVKVEQLTQFKDDVIDKAKNKTPINQTAQVVSKATFDSDQGLQTVYNYKVMISEVTSRSDTNGTTA